MSVFAASPETGKRFVRHDASKVISIGDKAISVPNYSNLTDILSANIGIYNQMNDSLFAKAPRDEWISTFLARAKVTGDLCQWNQDAIDYYLPRLWEDSIPDGYEDYLFTQFVQGMPIPDDFISEELLLRLDYIFEARKDRSDDDMSRFLVTRYRLGAAKHATSLSGDGKAFAEVFTIMKDIVDHYVPGRDVPNNSANTNIFFRACRYLLEYRQFIREGFWTDTDAIAFRQKVSIYLNNPVITKTMSAELRKSVNESVSSHEFGLLRNVYMPDTANVYQHVNDSLQHVYISYYDQHPDEERHLSSSYGRRLTIMRLRNGMISAQQALDICNYYKITRLREPVTQTNFTLLISSILDCVYCIDISTELTFDEKRQLVLGYVHEIYELLAELSFENRMPTLVGSLSNVATYERIHRYLVTAERKELLETLLFFSQPFTRAHSETVVRMAVTLLEGVIRYQPELVLGMRGYTTAEELQADPSRLISFFTDGARYHDLGKTRMPDIIRNDYRKLTDHEFSLIKRHPEFGLDYLKVDPSLEELHDIVLGHHKWYNGKGGYPAYFDNTQSPYRILIDILTLADCLEAGTARLGRNYRKNKTYDDIFREFQRDAGTRYNPDLVQFLAAHPTVAAQLRAICEKGWEDIYYNVFNRKN